MFLLLFACSDYQISPDEGDVEGAAPPEIQVRGLRGPSCGTLEGAASIRNEGTGSLELEAVRVDGEGWELLEPFSPLSLAPDEELRVLLRGGGADAELVVQSNDPENPELRAPLQTWPDEAPMARIEAPTEGETLGSGDVKLVAAVGDDLDASPGVSWISDVDGLIGVDPVSAWVQRSSGPHLLTLLVTDSCGNEARDEVRICQQAGYVADELDIGTWHFEGSARWDGDQGVVELTAPVGNQVGSAFQTSQTVSGDAVEIRFGFFIGGGSGADGLSLTAIDTDRMSTYLGGAGCGIGYGGDAGCTDGPALPGWSIEVDTWYNEGQDPTAEDHVMFTFDGDVDDPAAWAVLPEMEDNGWHTMEVVVAAPRVTVRIDNVTVIDAELGGYFAFPAQIGFTAGTGGSTNYHLIESLEVIEAACPE